MNCVQAKNSCSTPTKAFDVRFVERRVDFVEHAERAGPAAKNRQQQRHAGQRFFAAAEQRNVARLLARRTGDDLDAAIEDVDARVEHDVGLAAAEQLAEQRLEVLRGPPPAFRRTARRLSALILPMICASDFLAGSDPACCADSVAKRASSSSNSARAVEIHAADAVELRSQVGDLGLDLLPHFR